LDFDIAPLVEFSILRSTRNLKITKWGFLAKMFLSLTQIRHFTHQKSKNVHWSAVQIPGIPAVAEDGCVWLVPLIGLIILRLPLGG